MPFPKTTAVFLSAFLLSAPSGFPNGVLRDGAGGASMGSSGASLTADPGDPLSAMAGNPAGLGLIERPLVAFGLVGVYADAEFNSPVNDNIGLHTPYGIGPEAALAIPLGDGPFTLGLSFIPEALALLDWRFRDAPGGADGNTTYGLQTQRAQFYTFRSALGLGAKVNDRLSLGASVGLVYHDIELEAPFIFQSQPALKGIKTLLDLEADGFSVSADVGVAYRITDDLSFGLSYRSPTEIKSDGTARGDASAQFDSLGLGGTPSRFTYDAEVETALPQSVSAGLAWDAAERLTLYFQTDWINWSDSFDTLTVNLAKGTNQTINAVAGSDTITDRIPLDWSDRFVYRTGLEYKMAEDLFIRAGYSYGKNPLPDHLVTPLNAAIFEHTISAGVGFKLGATSVDVAYQYHLPNTVQVEESGILDGEFSNSSTRAAAHWLGITATVPF